jgi:hypothetical protein
MSNAPGGGQCTKYIESAAGGRKRGACHAQASAASGARIVLADVVRAVHRLGLRGDCIARIQRALA